MTITNDFSFLFLDERDPECALSKAAIEAGGILCIYVPSRGIREPQFCHKGRNYWGRAAILRALKRLAH